MFQSINIKTNSADDREALMSTMHSQHYSENILFLQDRGIEIVSPKTILKFVEEELIHDKDEILKQFGQTLNSMSSGERKRTYLKYAIGLKPDFLILDHFFDNLDIETRAVLTNELEVVNIQMGIINIYSRDTDQLSFINSQLWCRDSELSVYPYEITTKAWVPDIMKSSIPLAARHTDTFAHCLVQFKNVNISYLGKPILKNISWTINKGEFWHLYGPNGSGKTTLLTMITGDNPKAYNQDITLFGKKKGSGESVWDIKQKVGYFTSNMIFRFKRVQNARDMIISGFYDSIGLYRKPGDHEINLAYKWLEFLNLRDQAETPFQKMSLCQQRMVMIARAMVKHPPLLILDEPSVDLDENSREMMTSLISRIAIESDITLIYVSHRIDSGIEPNHSYELIPSINGSTGQASIY